MLKKRASLILYILLGVYGAVFFLMHLYCLDKAPNPVYLDEPWLSDAALQFLKNGRFGFSIFGDLYGLDKDVGFGNIHLFAEAMMFKLFGFGLYQARLVSFLSGLLLIWFTYLLGKKLYDRKTGIMSAVLFSLSGMFVDASHFARQEMMLALFMAASLYLYLLAREKRSKILYFITGLLLGAGRYAKWTYKAFSGSPDARDSYYYYNYLDKLKAHIPEDAVVLGHTMWFYGFYRQPYVAINYFEWALKEKNEKTRKKHGADFAEAVEKKKVDYIIIDDDFRTRMSRGSCIPPDQFFPFLKNKCELVATVMDGYHVGGFTPNELHRTEIYKVKR